MTLRDEVAQLIVMPIYGEAMHTRSANYRKYQHFVRDLHVGGVIVTGHVTNGSTRNAEPYAMAALLNRMQKLSRVPLLVAADFERGASMRVNSTTNWPYNMAFTAGKDLAGATFEGAETAREARSMGVNWVFAPVADVNNNPDNPIINIRSYGLEITTAVYNRDPNSDHGDPTVCGVKFTPIGGQRRPAEQDSDGRLLRRADAAGDQGPVFRRHHLRRAGRAAAGSLARD